MTEIPQNDGGDANLAQEVLELKEKLRRLEMEQTSAIGDAWTKDKAQQLFLLSHLLEDTAELTEAHWNALARQGKAGIDGEPELTNEEKRLIIEASDIILRKRKNTISNRRSP